jgi:formylglycine-generating enzyme required for sulfatase activity
MAAIASLLILLLAPATQRADDLLRQRILVSVRHAAFDAALGLAPAAEAAGIEASRAAYERSLAEARGATDPERKAMAAGRALAVAPESAAVRELLATLPERRDPYPLGAERDPASGRAVLVYAARDQAILVLVPDGEFLLGSNRPDALPEEMPQRRVSLHAFYVDRYEVTNRRYARFVAQTGRAAPPYWGGKEPPAVALDQPVTWVSHEDATAYARWAGLRLPTEVEWERAARGTDGRSYPWGDQAPDASLAELDRPMQGWPAEVASHPLGASPSGCVDMSGNVVEWTLDCFAPYRWRSLEDGVRNPPPCATGNYRVLRGGAFLDIPEFGRTTYRSFAAPDSRTGIFGFRVASD